MTTSMASFVGSQDMMDETGGEEKKSDSPPQNLFAGGNNSSQISPASMNHGPPSVGLPGGGFGSTGFSTVGSTSGFPATHDSNTPPMTADNNTIQTLLAANALDANTASLLLAVQAQANHLNQQQQQQQHQQQQQQQQLLQQQAAALVAVTAPFTHNLIPAHLQASALAASLNGTPGYQPALIPPPVLGSLGASLSLLQAQTPAVPSLISLPTMTVQDLPPGVRHVYNGVNPQYPGLRVLNQNPPVFAVDQFLTPLECQFLVTVASDSFGPAPVVGKGAGEVSASRTSSTCYLAREDLPDYMRKVSALTGKPIEHCELPQVGRYLPAQQYMQHFDAFDTSNEDGRRFAANGGQRTVTVLVYLNDVPRGGATRFPALNLDVQPRQGMALVFFPATVDGYLDKMALHAALPAVDPKFVSQVWIRQSTYNGQPSKRLPQTMGAPLNPPLGTAPAPQPITQTQTSTNTATTSNNSVIPNPFAASNLPTTF